MFQFKSLAYANPARAFAITVAILFAGFGAISQANAESEIYLKSGSQRVALLELYTSEGCSSCPPADNWLSLLTANDALWKQVVPVAFHVDYWDYIGWPDRFADARYTKRQREHASRLGMRTIYTPGLFLDGSEWRRWRGADPKFEAGAPAGNLAAIVDANAGSLAARFVDTVGTAGNKRRLMLHTAVLGFDVKTAVERGENTGRELKHDFVVLAYEKSPMDRLEPGEEPAIDFASEESEPGHTDSATFFVEASLPAAKENAPRRGIALWVSETNSTQPLQATGAWLPIAVGQ